MKHLAIILLLASVALGQQRVRPIDLTPETLTLIADSAKAIVSDSLATATNYDSVRAITSDSLTVHDATLRGNMIDSAKVVASDSIQFWKNLKTYTPQDFAANPDTVGAGISYDDTEEIQAALDNAGHVYLPKSSGRYVITSALKIKSNTYFEGAPGVEIYLADGSNDYMLQNYNCDLNTTIDSNIVVDGIRFNGNDAGQGANGLYPDWMGHGIFMDSVYNVTVKNCYMKDIVRFTTWVSHFNRLRFDNIGFDTEKDGIDVSVGNDLYINHLYGHTGDDMVAVFISAYQSLKQANDGNVTNIRINDINAYDVDTTDVNDYGASTGIYFGGSGTDGAFYYDNIHISNVTGDFEYYPIRILTAAVSGATYYPAGEQSTRVDDIVIENVQNDNVLYEPVRFKPTYANNVTIRNIRAMANGTQNKVVLMGDTTATSAYTNVSLENIFAKDSCQSVVYLEGATKFKNFKLHGLKGGNGSGALVYASNDTITGYFVMDNFEAYNIRTFYTQGVYYSTPVVLRNFETRHFTTPIIIKDSINLVLQNGIMDSASYSVQLTGGAGVTYRLLGNDIRYFQTSPNVYSDGAGTYSVNNPDLHAVTQNLTPQNGDLVFSAPTSTNAPVSAVVQWNSTDSLWHYYQNKYLTYSFDFDPPEIAANAYWDTTYTVAGLSYNNDVVIPDPPHNLDSRLQWQVRVSATNTIRVSLYNTTGSAYNNASTSGWLFLILKRP